MEMEAVPIKYLTAFSGSSYSNVIIISGLYIPIFVIIFSSKWFLDKVAGTAVDDAIRASKYVNDCNRKYYGCKLKSMSLEKMFEIFIRNIKK